MASRFDVEPILGDAVLILAVFLAATTVQLLLGPLLIAAFLTHAVFGCCWAQGTCAFPTAAAAAMEAHPHDDGHQHDVSFSHEGHRHDPAQPAHRCESSTSCVYVAVPKVKCEADSTQCKFALPVAPLSWRQCLAYAPAEAVGDTPATPLRPHLYHQILLI